MKKKIEKVEPLLPDEKPSFLRRIWTRFRSMIARCLRWLWRHKWWSLIGVIVIIVALATMLGGKSDAPQYATIPITHGNVRQVVTATGNINPVNTVSVGSQVSGIISDIYVDFNDVVKKGQVLMQIDPSVLQASVDNASASLKSAQAKADKAKADYKRSQELFDAGYIAKTDLETDKMNAETAAQTVKQAQSQYDTAKTNLGYATITSPVDGTVISRLVDVGQTVAASFQAPDLIDVAEDLTKMQIETAVSEADIGMVKNGQEVSFTVDAYPTQTFKGTVSQIRLSPTTTQNVVVYTVIIAVDNTDLKLMPGMTAYVTINVAESDNVYKAQNAAFLVRNLTGLSTDPRVQSGELKGSNTLLLLRDGNQVLMPYKKGLSSATETEIIPTGDVKPEKGDLIITGALGQTATATTTVRMGGRMR